VKPVLLDTGPIVASLDAGDPHHVMVCEGFGRLTGKLITTGAVVTEAMFFLQDLPNGPARLVDWLARIKAEIVDCFQFSHLQVTSELMARYADTPMDFADATLVLTAAHLDCGNVLTLDERGFRTYRFNRSKRFRLLLQDPS
jgi:hypothetical protein